jgi:amyloid beta precursor protein binding protein 1
VVYTLPITPKDLALVEEYGSTKNVPVISMRSVGFYAFFQFHLPCVFPVVEPHPDHTAMDDLRLTSPWEDLVTFSHRISSGLENMDNHEHGHVPYAVILLHFLDKWKGEHGGLYPTTYGEKVAFRQSINSAIRRNTPEGGEENFDEALAAVLKSVNQPSLPTSLQEILDYSPEKSVS